MDYVHCSQGPYSWRTGKHWGKFPSESAQKLSVYVIHRLVCLIKLIVFLVANPSLTCFYDLRHFFFETTFLEQSGLTRADCLRVAFFNLNC